MNDVILMRALHVAAVVIWIGGVAMATTILLPALRQGDFGPDRLRVFHAIERRFVWQARAATIIVALSGFYMTERLGLWARFRSAEFWWMHAMVGVWLLFTLVLFVVEPFFLDRRLRSWAAADPAAAFAFLHRAHWVLLALSLVTILGAVAGSQGLTLF